MALLLGWWQVSHGKGREGGFNGSDGVWRQLCGLGWVKELTARAGTGASEEVHLAGSVWLANIPESAVSGPANGFGDECYWELW